MCPLKSQFYFPGKEEYRQTLTTKLNAFFWTLNHTHGSPAEIFPSLETQLIAYQFIMPRAHQ